MIIGRYVSHNLDDLHAVLGEYAVRRSRLTSAEVVEKKAKDFAIQVDRGFAAVTPFAGQATAEAKGRGMRVKVRQKVYRQVIAQLGARAKAKGYRLRTVRRQTVRRGTGAARRTLNWRQEAIRRELATRERGRGYSRLAWRRHSLWSKGAVGQNRTVQMRTRSGYPVGKVSVRTGGKAPPMVRFESDQMGFGSVENRFGIVAAALEAVKRDTVAYLERRQRAGFERLARQRMRPVR